MAIVIAAARCDICGKTFEYNPDVDTNGLVFLHHHYSGLSTYGEAVDCCPSCMCKIMNFIDTMRKEKYD